MHDVGRGGDTPDIDHADAVTPPPADRPGVVLSIQYLRAFAAMLVVLHHARVPHAWLSNPMAGMNFAARGVDIFFVISGFIMFTAARNEPVRVFAWRRCIRVLPLYWLATLTFLAISLVAGKSAAALDILRSMFLIPFHNPAHGGAVWPLLVPGWTLMYEMFFYALFAVALVARRFVATLTTLILAFVISGRIVASDSAAWTIYTHPLLLEFLCGVWLGIAYRRYDISRLWPLLPIGIVALPAGELARLSEIWAGLPAAVAIVTGALAIEQRRRTPRWPLLRTLGDASYSIYLAHTLIMMVSNKIIRLLPLHGWPQFAVMVATTLIVSAVGGILVHRLVERPMLKTLSRIGRRRSAPTSGRVPAT